MIRGRTYNITGDEGNLETIRGHLGEIPPDVGGMTSATLLAVKRIWEYFGDTITQESDEELVRKAKLLRRTVRTQITKIVKQVNFKIQNTLPSESDPEEARIVNDDLVRLQLLNLDELAATIIIRKDMDPTAITDDQYSRTTRIKNSNETIAAGSRWIVNVDGKAGAKMTFRDAAHKQQEHQRSDYEELLQSLTLENMAEPEHESTRQQAVVHLPPPPARATGERDDGDDRNNISSRDDFNASLKVAIETAINSLTRSDGRGGASGLETSFRRLADNLERTNAQAQTNEKVPKFNGDYAKFSGYWQTFTALVDKHPRLSTITKLNKLIRSLEGEALELVENFEFEEESYPLAKRALKERFGDTTLCFDKMYKEFYEMERVRLNDSLELRKLHNRAKQLFLKSERLFPGQSTQWMVTSLESKMPSDCSFAWENYKTMKRSDGTPIPERELGSRLLTWLDGFIEDKKRSQVKTNKLSHESKPKKKTTTFGRPKTLSNFMTIEERRKTAECCVICKKNHPTKYCKCTGMTPQMIRSKIIEAKLCLNCFEDGHYAPECDKDGCKIFGCGKQHHHKLHYDKPEEKRKSDRFDKKKGSGTKGSGPNGSKKTRN